MFVAMLIMVLVEGTEVIEQGPWFKNKYSCEQYIDIALDEHNDVIGGFCDWEEVGNASY